MKAFIAFSIYDKDEYRQQFIEGISPYLGNIGATPVDSKIVFDEHFAESGGWDGFIEKVGTGMDYFTRQPLFDICICTNTQLGRASANLVSKFLEQKKPVFFVENGSSNFFEVLEVISNDEDDWQGGWGIRLNMDT